MKKIVLIPDSFKGTMSSTEICSIMGKAIREYYPTCEVISIPVADGGEGSVDCFLSALGGKRVNTVVKGPYFQDMESFYGVLSDKTAIIEMAACAGLPLVKENKHPELVTTYGVGQLMRHAIQAGSKQIIVGLGGSATNDGGAGMASALGMRFMDKAGKEFVPVGETLTNIASIDTTDSVAFLRGVEIKTMCDIDNPLCGENGAAHIFGPQKGADAKMVKQLDNNLEYLAKIVAASFELDIRNIPGAGAAGGMGAGMILLGAKLQMGIETVLDVVDFEHIVEHADLIFSGEGKLDTQSLRGKVVIGVARRAKKAGVPLVAVVGDIADNIEAAYDCGVSSIFSINRVAVPFSEAKLRSKQDLALTMDNIMRFTKAL